MDRFPNHQDDLAELLAIVEPSQGARRAVSDLIDKNRWCKDRIKVLEERLREVKNEQRSDDSV